MRLGFLHRCVICHIHLDFIDWGKSLGTPSVFGERANLRLQERKTYMAVFFFLLRKTDNFKPSLLLIIVEYTVLKLSIRRRWASCSQKFLCLCDHEHLFGGLFSRQSKLRAQLHLNLYATSRPACPTSSVVWLFLEFSQIPLQPSSHGIAVTMRWLPFPLSTCRKWAMNMLSHVS